MRAFNGMLVLALMLGAANAQSMESLRIKDIGKVSGWRENALVGYGLVTGLAGTGDSSRTKNTRQSIANMLNRFDVNLAGDDVQSRNVAAVMITANLPPFARPGDGLDITVTSIGDARSLVGGALILAPLKGADGRVYALAQGAISVGGYKYDLNGNVVQKNHPTVGSIPAGAIVEVGVSNTVLDENSKVTFVLAEPDYTTASRVAHAINEKFDGQVAEAIDASGIEIKVPQQRRARLTDFLATLENVTVSPDTRARVVINERTGTIVAGGDVKIAKVAISHGDLRLNISTENSVSQPLLVSRPGPGIQTAFVSNTQVKVDEQGETGFVPANYVTVADLVQALTKVKTNTRDIISILRAVKAQGAMRAELIVQ